MKDFRLSTLDISPGWRFTVQNQWLDQGTTNTQTHTRTHTRNVWFVKNTRLFKSLKWLSSSLHSSGIYKYWLTGSYPAITQVVMVLKTHYDLKPFAVSQDIHVLKRTLRLLQAKISNFGLRLQDISVIIVNNAYCDTACLFWSWVVLSPY